MTMHILFWGHGSWAPSDGHTEVPRGSQLFFFAKHREEINTERMGAILYAITTGLEREVKDVIKNEYFDLHEDFSLYRIKPEESRVKNYRLTPPSDGVYWPDPLDSSIAGTCKLVFTKEKTGELLGDLIRKHGMPNALYYWIPCRALKGDKEPFVDGGNFIREKGYFKG